MGYYQTADDLWLSIFVDDGRGRLLLGEERVDLGSLERGGEMRFVVGLGGDQREIIVSLRRREREGD